MGKHAPSMTKKNLLHFAENEAKKRGQRWTETREQVLDSLIEAEQPLTAYQLMDKVAERHKRTMQPASVYRSLDALISLGIVAKIESLNVFTVCQHPHTPHQHVFLVCDHCGHIDEIADSGISNKLTQNAATKGFKASHQVLELHGDCRTCIR